jgi:hypothetical protein
MMNNYMRTAPSAKPHLKPCIDVFRSCLAPGVHLSPAEKAVSSKSVVLTVTVHDILDGDKQIYRLDSPMVQMAKKRRAKTQTEKIKAAAPTKTCTGGSDDDSMVGDENDTFSLKSGAESDASKPQAPPPTKKCVYFRPQVRGVMVFPACHADVFVRFTVSEVSKWPNAVVIARTDMQVTDFILKRQAVVFSQQLELVTRSDRVVELAPLTRLNVANMGGSRADPSQFQLGQGRITWGFIPATGSSTMAGPLLLLPDVDAWGAKKRTWSVIIDKSLYVYASTADLVPRDVFDLSNCKVVMHENEVCIKIYTLKNIKCILICSNLQIK